MRLGSWGQELGAAAKATRAQRNGRTRYLTQASTTKNRERLGDCVGILRGSEALKLFRCKLWRYSTDRRGNTAETNKTQEMSGVLQDDIISPGFYENGFHG